MNYRLADGRFLVGVHDWNNECRVHGCAIHNPSDLPTVGWPVLWDDEERVLRRVCPHGVDHPDPDETRWRMRHGLPDQADIPGCGICQLRLVLVVTQTLTYQGGRTDV